MQAGKLRHRVTIQHYVEGSPQQKPSGAPDGSWTALDTVWARVRPLSGREMFLAQQAASRVDVEITIRHRADVTDAMRVVKGSMVYSIESVMNPEERGELLVLRCSTGQNNG